MSARTVAVILALLGVVGAGGAALFLTMQVGDESPDVTSIDGRLEPDVDGAPEQIGEGRRHVGAAGEEVDAAEPATAEPEGPATKAQRAILKFDEAESVPLILALATDPDPDSLQWGWAMNILQMLGPRAKESVPDLMRLMRDDEVRRQSAAYALGTIGEAAVDPLLESLAGGDAVLQQAALAALGMMRPPPRRATEAVVSLFAHPDVEIRRLAVGALWIDDRAADVAVPALIGALSDPDEEVRQGAVYALYFRGPAAAAAVGALGHLLHDESEYVAAWAAQALGHIGPAAASETETLVALLAADPDRWEDSIPEALSGIGTAALLQALGSQSSRARVLAIPFVPGAVESDGTTAAAAVAALDAALSSDDADVRRAAADALGTLGPPASTTVASLLTLADDSNPVVSRAALIAVVRVGGARDKVLDVLVRELSDGSDMARAAAAEALGELGSDAAPAVDALAVAANDPDLVVRERAARALESIGPAAITAASSLAGRLGDAAERVRLAAAIALTAVDPPGLAARDAIEELRISDSPKIRRGLMEGLGRHPNAVWLDVVVNRIDDRDADVRGAAAQALMQYTAHSPTVVPALVARLEKERSAGVQLALIGVLGKHGKGASAAAPLLERIASNTTTLVMVRDAARDALTKIR